jgi:hypothetical protein
MIESPGSCSDFSLILGKQQDTSRTSDNDTLLSESELERAPKLPAALQAGLYGANMISRPGVAAHAIGLVIRGLF